jgi:hypothetical protein
MLRTAPALYVMRVMRSPDGVFLEEGDVHLQEVAVEAALHLGNDAVARAGQGDLLEVGCEPFRREDRDDHRRDPE